MSFEERRREERRQEYIQLAVLEQRLSQVEKRCDSKDMKIEALQAFQNRALGYAMAASAIAAIAVQYFYKIAESQK